MMRRRGFTLVELMVALILTALVALLAHRTFAVAVTGVRQLREARRQLDRASNAGRWLGAAFLSLELGQEGDGPFEGTHEELRFTTWLPVPGGWLERRTVRLRRRGAEFVAAVDGATPVVLAQYVTDVSIDYLLEPGANTRWASAWSSPVSAPIAIRLRIRSGERADTALYLIKGRG